MVISRRILLRIRNVSDEICREAENANLCSITFSRKLYRFLDNVENMEQPDRPRMTIHHDTCALPAG